MVKVAKGNFEMQDHPPTWTQHGCTDGVRGLRLSSFRDLLAFPTVQRAASAIANGVAVAVRDNAVFVGRAVVGQTAIAVIDLQINAVAALTGVAVSGLYSFGATLG